MSYKERELRKLEAAKDARELRKLMEQLQTAVINGDCESVIVGNGIVSVKEARR